MRSFSLKLIPKSFSPIFEERQSLCFLPCLWHRTAFSFFWSRLGVCLRMGLFTIWHAHKVILFADLLRDRKGCVYKQRSNTCIIVGRLLTRLCRDCVKCRANLARVQPSDVRDFRVKKQRFNSFLKSILRFNIHHFRIDI